jgi:hypothetical protein
VASGTGVLAVPDGWGEPVGVTTPVLEATATRELVTEAVGAEL